jgi:hypothetical protein
MTRAALLLAVALAGCGGSQDCPRIADVRASWSHASTRSPAGKMSARQELAKTLVRCRTLVGRTKANVRRLLGRPTVWPADRNGPLLWDYFTGSDPRSPSDGTGLTLLFGRGGRVTRAATP